MLDWTGSGYRIAHAVAVVLALLVWAIGAAQLYGWARLGLSDPVLIERLQFVGILLGGIGYFLPRVQAPPTPTRLAAEYAVKQQRKESSHT